MVLITAGHRPQLWLQQSERGPCSVLATGETGPKPNGLLAGGRTGLHPVTPYDQYREGPVTLQYRKDRKARETPRPQNRTLTMNIVQLIMNIIQSTKTMNTT